MPQPVRAITVIAFDGVQGLDVVGPMEVFAAANRDAARYQLRLLTPGGAGIRTHAGLSLTPDGALGQDSGPIDTLIVCGGSEAALRGAAVEPSVRRDLCALAGRARRVASVCVGALVLAGAGLLDGRRATTHWNALHFLRGLGRDIRVEPDAIFVRDGAVYTSGGVTAGIDLSLALVEEDCGPEVARDVAKELLLYLRRPGGQSQFSFCLEAQVRAAPRIQSVIQVVLQRPADDLSVPVLAAMAGMSERTFLRNFRRDTGMTPAAFVEAARVDQAKAMLETSDWPLARVADRAGFGSIAALHRAFARRVGTAPGFYRDRFGARG
ncbi:helix-turn-helix domain-containing protein [Tabrizicola sp.]|uniref:GlxA family transcriptional regulator n=1 Tax=Tabrizicola sp. TaxID=2005166 RepID=UPI00286C98CE|nr:helix-turn-helix domain-containing protein [Tabrizicola sp.]